MESQVYSKSHPEICNKAESKLAWYSMSLIVALKKQRKEDFWGFKTNLINNEASETTRASKKDPVWKTKSKPSHPLSPTSP